MKRGKCKTLTIRKVQGFSLKIGNLLVM